MFNGIEIWGLGGPLQQGKVFFMFLEPSPCDLGFVYWCIILMEVTICLMINCQYEWVHLVSNDVYIYSGCLDMSPRVSMEPTCAKKTYPTPWHWPCQLSQLRSDKMDPWIHVCAKFYICHQHNVPGIWLIRPSNLFPAFFKCLFERMVAHLRLRALIWQVETLLSFKGKGNG